MDLHRNFFRHPTDNGGVGNVTDAHRVNWSLLKCLQVLTMHKQQVSTSLALQIVSDYSILHGYVSPLENQSNANGRVSVH